MVFFPLIAYAFIQLDIYLVGQVTLVCLFTDVGSSTYILIIKGSSTMST